MLSLISTISVLSTLASAATTTTAVNTASSSSTAASVVVPIVLTPTPTAAPVVIAAVAGSTPLPLTQYSYAYDQVPYQVNPFQYLRGPQSGYNQCNSTTAGPNALCQTALINSLSDFCLWGSATPNELIGNIEAAVVAFCSNNKTQHGSRLMPAGTLTGVQYMKTSAYIQVVGRLNMTGVNLATTDSGGELDPHGADLLGNPLGGLVYSNSLPTSPNLTTQAISWNNFIGSGQFCFKLCDPSVTNVNYCENRYDLLGCAYNAPAAYTDNLFVSCEGDLQDVVGTYTSGGATLTWSQPDVLTTSPPWTPRIPASSNCVTYKSADLYGALPTISTTSTTPSATATGSSGSKGATTGPSATASSAAATASVTKSAGVAKTAVGAGALLFAAAALMIVV